MEDQMVCQHTPQAERRGPNSTFKNLHSKEIQLKIMNFSWPGTAGEIESHLIIDWEIQQGFSAVCQSVLKKNISTPKCANVVTYAGTASYDCFTGTAWWSLCMTGSKVMWRQALTVATPSRPHVQSHSNRLINQWKPNQGLVHSKSTTRSQAPAIIISGVGLLGTTATDE